MIAGIVLAAGRSVASGPPQAIAAGPRRAADPAHPPSRAGVIAGSGNSRRRPRGGLVRDAVAGLPVECVFNPDSAAGQSTSVRAGLAALSPEVESAVFILGDQPGVDPKVIDALIAAWRTSAPRSSLLATRTEWATRSCSTGGSSQSWPLWRAIPGRVSSSAPITTPANCYWCPSPDRPHRTSTPKPTTPRSSPRCHLNDRAFSLSPRTGGERSSIFQSRCHSERQRRISFPSNGRRGYTEILRYLRMTRRVTAALSLERAFVHHPVERATERLHGLVDIISGVGDARHASRVEQIDTFKQHSQVEQPIQPSVPALFQSLAETPSGTRISPPV